MSFRLLKSVESATVTRQKYATADRYRTIRKFFSLQTNVVVIGTTRQGQSLICRSSIRQRLFHSGLSQRQENPGPIKDLLKQNAAKERKKARKTDGDSNHPQKPLAYEDKVSPGSMTPSYTDNSSDKPPPTEDRTPTEPPPTLETNPPAHDTTPPPPQPRILPYNFEYYSRSFRQLAMSLPHLHRPTQDDFLRVADGFWQRLRIRFKWFTIKSFRKFNADDISGIVTWILMSQTIWILVGTTTFLSVVFAIANSLRLQHFIARGISDYLTSETGITIIFESAIVPKWKDSRISFKNVYVSRRPMTTPRRKKIDAHMAVAGIDVGNQTAYNDFGEDEDEEPEISPEEDTNYSMFDLNIDSVDVTLSLWRWLDGRGLVEDAVVKGVRGVLDRRSVRYDPDHPLDPASFRHESHPGDFELDSLQLEDLLITVYQPGGFRPYTASIFRADIRTFRKKWLFYDFLSAENVVGQFDNCLFSLHKPQSIGRTMESDMQDGDWVRMSRIRIDGMAPSHGSPLENSTQFFDIKFPKDPDALDLNDILEEIADAISTTLSSSPALDPLRQRIPGQRELAKPPLSAPEALPVPTNEQDKAPKLVVELDLRFRDVKAAVPIFTNDLSYVNNALIRPIVAFMNANRTLVPIHCRVVKKLSEFDGAWTIYDALAYHVTQANINRRIKTVSVWSLQMTASAVLSTLRNLMDPVSIRVREAYLRSQEERELYNAGDITNLTI
ncbi:mitochondrial distribution and morphology protein-domain-containing protein [Rhodocollybia butyracea]|uniref:Mitochondrial distribution and morphology protein-domain-containing protein n=1 Tax=Rhodocollybia butyracea TaxID=206335 RepID=A0A9P5PQX8_9AGAR|nr:mitochondrial distribution and morphology protein-domain-containing protein [Rhodocollybia butyracea]